MMRKTTPLLEGTLAELSETGKAIDELWNLDSISKAFRYDDHQGEFRIPAADTGAEVFFNKREILARFTSMGKPLQCAFLKAVRRAMQEHDVEHFSLTVAWGGKSKTLQIRTIGHSRECLNIYI